MAARRHGLLHPQRAAVVALPAPRAAQAREVSAERDATIYTRTNVQFLKGGEGKLGAVRLQTVVLSSGRNISSTTARWNANVSGQNQWNSNHQSTQGRNFQMYYKLDFIGPNNLTSSYEFKSRITGACNDPYPAAYRCLF